jgi:hypothetical protein
MNRRNLIKIGLATFSAAALPSAALAFENDGGGGIIGATDVARS